MRATEPPEAGFTLIELTIVMVILAVFTVVLLPLFRPSSATVAMDAERLLRDIRHMQMLAISWEQPMHMTVTSTGYSVRCYNAAAPSPCNGSSVIKDPATSADFNVAFEYSATSASSLEMDSLGRPIVSGAVISSNTDFVLSAGGTSKTVRIIPVTGFVQVL